MPLGSGVDLRLVPLAAFACGVLTGVSLGLLFAPARGRETRHWMADRSRIAREYLRERNRRAREVVRREGVRELLHRQDKERTAAVGREAAAPGPAVASDRQSVAATAA